MAGDSLTAAKRRLLDELKRSGPATAFELSSRLELTDVAVRQHLTALRGYGLVEQRMDAPQGRGRPSARWRLTQLAAEIFPDRHAELTVGLIEGIRRAFGAEGLDRVIGGRAQDQIEAYRRDLPGPKESLKRRVEQLARQRTTEGYMAEVVEQKRGCYLLVEHHCPICEAARSCTGLCSAELEVFQETLGDGIAVERQEHLLSGDDRCVYRIQTRGR